MAKPVSKAKKRPDTPPPLPPDDPAERERRIEAEVQKRLELQHLLERLKDDEPWVLDDRPRCFLCGIELRGPEAGAEHIVPQWLIRRFELATDHGKLNHPFQFREGVNIPYPKLTVPACHNCNTGFLRRLEVEVADMCKPRTNDSRTYRSQDLLFWLAKLLWGIAWLEMKELKREGQHGAVRGLWKHYKPVRCCLQVIRKEARFANGVMMNSGFLFNCQVPEKTEEQFDFLISLPFRAVYIRIRNLVVLTAFDMGFVNRWDSGSFDPYVGRHLHPWQVEQLGARFFEVASMQQRAPFIATALYKDHVEFLHVPESEPPPWRNDPQLYLELLTRFNRMHPDYLSTGDGRFRNFLVGPDGGFLQLDLREHPWRRRRQGPKLNSSRIVTEQFCRKAARLWRRSEKMGLSGQERLQWTLRELKRDSRTDSGTLRRWIRRGKALIAKEKKSG